MPRRAVFLDRDGTLNVDKAYLHAASDWQWIPGAIEAIRLLNDAGLLVIVTTNQSGIARGYYDAAAVQLLHTDVDAWLSVQGAHIDGYYFCPHHPDYSPIACDCRKPAPGMLLAAARAFDIDLTHSFVVGDSASDVEAGLAAGAQPILVATGDGTQERVKVGIDVPFVADVLAAVHWILGTGGALATSTFE
jgi:D-glycero-D-manno-heptose 1,7-bisphosphate phosphatase